MTASAARSVTAPGDPTPWGTWLICEEGEIFPFAQNNIVLDGERNGFVGDFRGSEWAGACYGTDGKWLFANVQSPGLTVAITGPWKSGAL